MVLKKTCFLFKKNCFLFKKTIFYFKKKTFFFALHHYIAHVSLLYFKIVTSRYLFCWRIAFACLFSRANIQTNYACYFIFLLIVLRFIFVKLLIIANTFMKFNSVAYLHYPPKGSWWVIGVG